MTQDLPASCGWESGTVLEVLVFPAKKRSNSDVVSRRACHLFGRHTIIRMTDERGRCMPFYLQWWPATLGKRAAGKTDADGRQLYSIT